MMQKVALLGLGIMGSGMVANLLKNGFELTVYNRTRERAEPFAAQGARIADTPKQAAQDADVMIGMVGDDDASRAVWLGEDGALAGAKSGAVIIECSTLTPDWVRELAAMAAEHGCNVLDAPVTGSKAAADNGQLRMLVGGDAEVLEQVRAVFEAISSEIVHLGGMGAGATFKLINNMMAAVQVVALAEGVALAEKAGINLDEFAKLIPNSAVNSNIVCAKLPRMVAQHYDDIEFALKWMQKDVSYALRLGENFNMSLETAQAAFDVIQKARDKGYDEKDFASMVEGLRE